MWDRWQKGESLLGLGCRVSLCWIDAEALQFRVYLLIGHVSRVLISDRSAILAGELMPVGMHIPNFLGDLLKDASHTQIVRLLLAVSSPPQHQH